jgi:surface carbohydrate biosynthesis protein
MQKISIIINIILHSFFQFSNWQKPKYKKIIIYDKEKSEFVAKYLNKNDFIIFNNRFDKYLRINFYIVFYLILRLEFNFKSYKNTFIKFTNPKFIISGIDNNPGFYELKNNFPNIKTIMIQFSYKYADFGIFEKKKLRDLIKNKKSYYVDHIFVFNKYFEKLFKKFIIGNYHIIGSFMNNSQNNNFKNKKINYLYISKGFLSSNNFNWNNFLIEETKLLKNLSNYLFKKGEILTIAGKSQNYLEEKLFFENICGKNKIHFIKSSSNSFNIYRLLLQAKIVLSTDSTLQYENLSRDFKTCIFAIRSRYHFSRKFGWPARFKDTGRFWTNTYSFNEINRILSYVNKVKKKDLKNYLKKIRYYNDILFYDKENKKFKIVAKKIKLIE